MVIVATVIKQIYVLCLVVSCEHRRHCGQAALGILYMCLVVSHGHR